MPSLRRTSATAWRAALLLGAAACTAPAAVAPLPPPVRPPAAPAAAASPVATAPGAATIGPTAATVGPTAATPAAGPAAVNGTERPLFQQYPALGARVDLVPLAAFPTPVERLQALGDRLGIAELYVKRDDLAGDPYGGSKVRKLELLLAEARRQHKRAVITFGGVGSNQALATVWYARRLGLGAVLLLVPHPVITDDTRYKLLAERALGAELRHFPNMKQAEAWANEATGAGRSSPYYVIPSGGSTPLGNLGFVNAAFELAAQVRQGALPEPDLVYVAAGTLGSAAGLILGLRAAGLKTRLVAVPATPSATQGQLDGMIRQTSRWLRSLDSTFPDVAITPGDARVDARFLGYAYGHETEPALRAIALCREHAGLELEASYTAKTFATLASDLGGRSDRVVVFWNTYDARKPPLPPVTVADLPAAFRIYFEATGSVPYWDLAGTGRERRRRKASH